MTTDYYLTTDSNKYKLSMLDNSVLQKIILEDSPITGEGNNIGGEIYFLTNVDIPFDGTEKEIFEIGDVVYWRSQSENIFAIAVFYGNTSHGNGDAPTAASPCMKLGTIQGDCSNLKSVISGTKIHLVGKNYLTY